MYTPEGKNINFKRDYGECEGITYTKMRNKESGVMEIQTLRKHFEGHTKKETEKYKLSYELRGMVGYPSEHEYKDMETNKLLPYFPSNTNAKYILGTNLSGVRGNTARKSKVGWIHKNTR